MRNSPSTQSFSIQCSTHFKGSQLSCVEKLKLQHLYKSLELFVGWIMDGFYDFRHVPYAMKIKLPEEAKRQISKIPDGYEGTFIHQVTFSKVMLLRMHDTCYSYGIIYKLASLYSYSQRSHSYHIVGLHITSCCCRPQSATC